MTAAEAFLDELARLRARGATRERTALLVVLARWAARLLVALPRLRTALLAIGGFGLLSAAAWMVAVPLGLATAGVSLLVLEYLSGEDRRR